MITIVVFNMLNKYTFAPSGCKTSILRKSVIAYSKTSIRANIQQLTEK